MLTINHDKYKILSRATTIKIANNIIQILIHIPTKKEFLTSKLFPTHEVLSTWKDITNAKEITGYGTISNLDDLPCRMNFSPIKNSIAIKHFQVWNCSLFTMLCFITLSKNKRN